MRAVACIVALAIMAPLGAAPARASTSDLVQQLDGAVAAFPGGAGIWVADPNASSPLFAHNPDERIITASLYKLGILAEAERRVERGELRYTDVITIEDVDVVTDGSFEPVGTVLTVDEALEAMITISDNGSAQALWRIFGGADVDADLAQLGIRDFHIAFDHDEDNWATPRAVGTFFAMLAKGQLVSPAASARMLARLGRQQINDRLPAQLPAGVVVAHKTGNLPALTHDAGIIFTPSGPRVVVVMTWNAFDGEADSFIASVGALVYSAILEPYANARYQVTKAALSAQAGATQQVTIPITNIGTRAWTSAGAGSVGLLWEVRAADGQVLAKSAKPEPLPALAPNQTRSVKIDLAIPSQPGTYAVTVGLADASGAPLAAHGAATASFSVRAHPPYLVNAEVRMPAVLHHGEASPLVTAFSALPITTDHTLTLTWRLSEARSNRSVKQGTSPMGVLHPEASGAFFSSFFAPNVTGTFRLSYELSEDGVAVSATSSRVIEIVAARTYPDDEDGRPIPAGALIEIVPGESRRFEVPELELPKPSFALPFIRERAP